VWLISQAIAHAGELGFVAVVLTVDTVNNGNREKSYKSPEWIQAIVNECGGFPETRGFEHVDVGNLAGAQPPMQISSIFHLPRMCHL
jgi:hypothetical protein